MRKATRTYDIDSTPLITEGIIPPPDPAPPPKALSYKPTNSPPDPTRRFRLLNTKDDAFYKDKDGNVVLFKSKSSAKKCRNQLNNRHGSGHYYVVQVPKEELVTQAEFDLEDTTLEEALELATWGGWGC